jgi:hypothetical protein
VELNKEKCIIFPMKEERVKNTQFPIKTLLILALVFIAGSLALEPFQEQEQEEVTELKTVRPRSVEGNGEYTNGLRLIIDGHTPPEEGPWNGTQCVFWTDTQTFFVIDFGGNYDISAILVQVDTDDSYKIDYSLDGSEYFDLTTISADFGDFESGMDTLSTQPDDPQYVQEMEFEPVQARYLKIYATEGNGEYSVSEVKIFESPEPLAEETESEPIQPAGIEGFGEFSNDAGLIIDGETPPQGGDWNGTRCVYWEDPDTYFIIDLGGRYSVSGIVIQVDHDDYYRVEYSLDNIDYITLFEITDEMGEITAGMDTISTIPDTPEYIEDFEFFSQEARYIRISASEGNGVYSISEISIFKTEAEDEKELPVN